MEKEKPMIFRASIRPIISEEKDAYLALASLDKLKQFIPNIDTDTNIDLLPVAFNACVANRFNSWDDGIDTETAITIAKTFINKPINLEHDRKTVVGCITNYGYSEFGTDKPLTEDEVKDLTKPFNLVLGGVIWRSVSEKLAELIEEASDPTSKDYEMVSASWELGIRKIKLVLIEGKSKNLEDAKEIMDSPTDKAKYMPYLSALGGTGSIDKNTRIYRLAANEDCIGMGIGLTETPAAEVKGVATKTQEVEENEESEEINATKENKVSQQPKETVNTNSKIMKVTSLDNITDENLKEITASEITSFLKSALKEASDKFTEEKGDLEAKASEAEKAKKEFEDKVSTLDKELKSTKDALASLEAEKSQREAQQKLDVRMASLDEKYTLGNEERKIIVKKIKDMDDEAYNAYASELEVFLSSKVKATEVEEVEETEVIASAVDNADKEKSVPAGTAPATEMTLAEKAKKAFANIKIK